MQRYGPCRATAAERPHHVPQMRPGRRSTPQHDSPVAQEGGGPMTPASPAETAKFEARRRAYQLIEQGHVVEAVAELQAKACPDPTLHAVADAPLRPLSNLLEAAVLFDEIADHLIYEYDLLAIEIARIKAVQAAVRALQGPPAPFRPQQAHAAPAKCNAACFEHPAKGGEA